MKLKEAVIPLLALSTIGILACGEDSSSTNATPSSAISCNVTTSGNTVTMTYKAGMLTSTTTADIGEDSVETTIKTTWSYSSEAFEAACTEAKENAEEDNENLENFECNNSGYSYNYTEANEGTTVSDTKAGFEYACSALESAANGSSSSSSNGEEENSSSSSAKTDLSSSSIANDKGSSNYSSSSENNSEVSSHYSSSENGFSSSGSETTCNITTSGDTMTMSTTEEDTSVTMQVVVEEDSITMTVATTWSLSAADVENVCAELNADIEENADGSGAVEFCDAKGSRYSYKIENPGFTITDMVSMFGNSCSEESTESDSYAKAKIAALKKAVRLAK